VAAIAAVALSDGASEPGPAGAPGAAAVAPQLARSFTDPSLAVLVRHPAGWSAGRRSGAVRVAARDRTVVISVSAPAPAREARSVLRTALQAIEAEYGDVRVSPGGDRTIAGLRTRSAVVSATNARGTPVRVLVAAASGRRRAYLVQVFAARDAPAGRLAEAQAVLGSLTMGR
jgi:hypothetical protein